MAKLKIIYVSIDDIEPYANNPRLNDGSVDGVANSIKKFNWKQPIVVDKNKVIIAGHTRYAAAKKLGLKEVPIVIADDLTEEEVKAYRLADNKVGENSLWDFDKLDQELNEILGIDMADFGFTDNELIEFDEPEDKDREEHEPLADAFIVPPFSVLDTRQGYWQDRKRCWVD